MIRHTKTGKEYSGYKCLCMNVFALDNKILVSFILKKAHKHTFQSKHFFKEVCVA